MTECVRLCSTNIGALLRYFYLSISKSPISFGSSITETLLVISEEEEEKGEGDLLLPIPRPGKSVSDITFDPIETASKSDSAILLFTDNFHSKKKKVLQQ
ncbi:hypothetical protein TNCV_3334261 [Trichonephila clavipes]|nr:hypothetical protein TNCV_3334261 [Trichonephila clavipes]